MSTIYQVRGDQHSQPIQSMRNLYSALFRDLISIGLVGILLLCIHELGQPFIRGFNCNDETIRYPFKDSTVSSAVCYFVGSGVNIILILVIEYLNLISRKQVNDQATSEAHRSTDGQFKLGLYIRNVYCRLLIWLFGSITSELLTDISKVTAGRLRPHFINVCQPQVKGVPLDSYCKSASNPFEYITDYECTGNPKKLRDIRLSFLSGHSSYSAYSATFAILYLQSSLDINKFGLIKPAFQVLLASAAFYTGLSRVSDYKHHWQDVLAGLVLGTTVASVVSTCIWPAFNRTYIRYWNKYASVKLTNPNEVPAAELNRLGY